MTLKEVGQYNGLSVCLCLLKIIIGLLLLILIKSMFHYLLWSMHST